MTPEQKQAYIETILTINKARAIRTMCYGDEHRPVTNASTSAKRAANAAAAALAEHINSDTCPWDLHLSNAVFHITLADSPEDAYAKAALLASICITMMLDLHSQL